MAAKGTSPTPKFCSRCVRTFERAAFLLLCWLLPVPFFEGERPRLSIRNKTFPWGIPGLQGKDAEKVEGNAWLRAALRIIYWLEQHEIPYILEHPASSKIWFITAIMRLLNKPHVQAVNTDFCQYGTPWQKRTQLVCSWIDELDVHRCCRICQGPLGTAQQARSTFSSAQPYPLRFCHALAYALASSLRVVS